MKRIFALFGVAASLSAATPASSQVVLEMSQITCKDFAAMDPATKPLVAAWILGYFNAGRNLNVVQERYLDRNLEKLGEYCKHHPTSGILADIEKIGH
jgi:acid stress chaperone HdeB